MATPYAEVPNKMVTAGNGVDYAYRELGASAVPASTVPLVLLQHFRGNLDNWDPALIDALASSRRVVTFARRGARLVLASSAPQGAAGMQATATR
jgi:hypothetical protein